MTTLPWKYALKRYNEENPATRWIVPEKGGKIYQEVRDIMSGKKEKATAKIGKAVSGFIAKKKAKAEGQKIKEEKAGAKIGKAVSGFLAKKKAKKVVQAKRIEKNPNGALSVWFDEIEDEILRSNWEDIGDVRTQAKIWRGIKNNICGDKKLIDLYPNSTNYGALKSEDFRDYFETEEDYYRSDGDYGGTDWNRISVNQGTIYALCLILDYLGWDGNEISDNHFTIRVNSIALYNASDVMDEYAGKSHIYYQLYNAPKYVKDALRAKWKPELYYPNEKEDELEEWLNENDEYEDYYGSFLYDEGLAVDIVWKNQFYKEKPKEEPKKEEPKEEPKKEEPKPTGEDYKKWTNDKLREAIKSHLRAKKQRLTNLGTATKAKLIGAYEKYVLRDE